MSAGRALLGLKYLAILLTIALLLWLLIVTVARAQEVSPALIIQFDGEAHARTPAGERIALPAGSQVDACVQNGVVAEYRLASRSYHVLQPCTVLFRDGFER